MQLTETQQQLAVLQEGLLNHRLGFDEKSSKFVLIDSNHTNLTVTANHIESFIQKTKLQLSDLSHLLPLVERCEQIDQPSQLIEHIKSRILHSETKIANKLGLTPAPHPLDINNLQPLVIYFTPHPDGSIELHTIDCAEGKLISVKTTESTLASTISNLQEANTASYTLRQKHFVERLNKKYASIQTNTPVTLNDFNKGQEFIIYWDALSPLNGKVKIYFKNVQGNLESEVSPHIAGISPRLRKISKNLKLLREIQNKHPHSIADIEATAKLDPALKTPGNFKIVPSSHSVVFYNPITKQHETIPCASLEDDQIQQAIEKVKGVWNLHEQLEKQPRDAAFPIRYTKETVSIWTFNDFEKECWLIKRNEDGSFSLKAKCGKQIASVKIPDDGDLQQAIKQLNQQIALRQKYADKIATGPVDIKAFKKPFVNVNHFVVDFEEDNRIKIQMIDAKTGQIVPHFLSLKPEQTVDEIHEQLQIYVLQQQEAWRTGLADIKEKFVLSPGYYASSKSASKNLGAVKYEIQMLYNETNPMGVPGVVIKYIHPREKKVQIYEIAGFNLEKIQKSIDYIEHSHQLQETFESWKKQNHYPFNLLHFTEKPTQEQLEITPFILQGANDSSHFIIRYRHPANSSLFYHISTKGLTDLDTTLDTAKEQIAEIQTLKLSSKLLGQTSQIAGVEIPPPREEIDINELLDIFDKIDFENMESPWYVNPTMLTNDGLPATVEEFTQGITQLIENIAERLHALGVPVKLEAREVFYQKLERLLSHVIHGLKTEEDTRTTITNTLDIAESSLHCGTRWMGDSIRIFYTQKGFVGGEQAKTVDLEELLLQISDSKKIRTLFAMIEKSGNDQNSHEMTVAMKALTEKGVAIPLAAAAEYEDVYSQLAFEGEYTSTQEIVANFMDEFNGKTYLDEVVETINNGLRNPQTKNSYAHSLTVVLRAAAEKQLSHYPETANKFLDFEKMYERIKAAAKTPQEIDEAAEQLATNKAPMLDEIVEKENWLVLDDELYLPKELSRSGAKALLDYYGLATNV